jgi:ribonuclease P protein subunit POP4
MLALVGGDTNAASVCAKVVKADLTGARLTVAQSRNPAMLAARGIVVKETVRCLFVINEANQVKNLLKAGSVFEIQLPHPPGKAN